MFEELLYKHLISQKELTEALTQYNGIAAVFNQKVPDDVAVGWSKEQCPRIVFYISKRTDPERETRGVLGVDVICSDVGLAPEPLERIVRESIDGYFFSTIDSTTSVQWMQSDYFTEADKKNCGVTLSFELLDFPVQKAPNNFIGALNSWTKTCFKNSTVIGLDNISEVWKPTNLSPAIYWRIGSIKVCEWIPSNAAGNWYTAFAYGHVIAPDFNIMNDTAMSLLHHMNMKSVLRLQGDTLMRIDHNNSFIPGSDEYRNGQLSCECTYCILNQRETGQKLNHIYINNVERS